MGITFEFVSSILSGVGILLGFSLATYVAVYLEIIKDTTERQEKKDCQLLKSKSKKLSKLLNKIGLMSVFLFCNVFVALLSFVDPKRGAIYSRISAVLFAVIILAVAISFRSLTINTDKLIEDPKLLIEESENDTIGEKIKKKK